jgi:Leucine Rich repeat
MAVRVQPLETLSACESDVKAEYPLLDIPAGYDGYSLVIDVLTSHSNSSNKTKTLTLTTTLTNTFMSSVSNGVVLGMARRASKAITKTQGNETMISSTYGTSNSSTEADEKQSSSQFTIGAKLGPLSFAQSFGSTETHHTATSSANSHQESNGILDSNSLSLSFTNEMQFSQEMSVVSQHSATTSHIQAITEDIDCPPDHIVARRVYLYVRPGRTVVVGKAPRWVLIDSVDDTLHKDYQQSDARLRKQFSKLDKEWCQAREQASVQYELGCILSECDKDGQESDIAAAKAWFHLAASQGHAEAKRRFEELTMSSEEAEDAIRKAFELCQGRKIEHKECHDMVKRAMESASSDFETLRLSYYEAYGRPIMRKESFAIIINTGLMAKLRTLDLKKCHVDAKLLANALPESSLTSLNLLGAVIDRNGATAIAQVLPQTQLTYLNLGVYNFYADDAKAIAKALPHCKLTSLVLYLSAVGDAGGVAIASSIAQSNLTSLNLADAHIGTATAVALANNLAKSSLQYLNLSTADFNRKNRIDYTGAIALARALRHSCLRSLNLSGNSDISYNGCMALARSVHLSCLDYLGVRRCMDPGTYDSSAGKQFKDVKAILKFHKGIADY